MWEEGVRIYGTPGVPNNFPPQPGTAAPKRETEELEGSNNSKLVEINAAMIEEEVTVEMEFQLRDSFNPKVNEELMPPNNAPITQKLVLIQKDKSACPELVTLNEGCGNPVVMEINWGGGVALSQFHSHSIPSSSNQCLVAINDTTLAASTQGVLPHGLDDQDEAVANQSTIELVGQHNSLRTWKRVMRQGSNGVHASQLEPEKKRKSSFNTLDEPYPPKKRVQVLSDYDDTSNTMVEAAVQPHQEPWVY